MAACRECGAELVGGACARCAKIDALMPNQLEPPPPVEIPGPPSSLSNTLSATVPERPEELARFAAPPRNRIADMAKDLGLELEEKECPRCAEKIKARAKVCRFCDYDFEKREPAQPKKTRSSGRHRAIEDGPREVHHHHHGSQLMQPLRSPGVAAVLSFFYPGLGQLYCGKIVSGFFMIFLFPLILWLGVLGGAGIFFRLTGSDVGAVVVGVAILIGLYLWAIIDAYYTAESLNYKAAGDRPSRRRRWRR